MAAMERESTGRGERIPVTRSVSVPMREITFRFSRSSGPGGQHAQRTETRVEALFDVAASSALTDRQKSRVIAKAGPILHAVAQGRNRELAVERLCATLRDALAVKQKRRPTRPSKRMVEQRLEAKRRQSERKRRRRPPDVDS
jgi:ribosome-associated protein